MVDARAVAPGMDRPDSAGTAGEKEGLHSRAATMPTSSARSGVQPRRVLRFDMPTLRIGLTVFLSSLAGTLVAVWVPSLDPNSIYLMQTGAGDAGPHAAKDQSGAAGNQPGATATATTTPNLLEICRSGKAPLRDAIANSSKEASFHFERCALVGSSPILHGKGRGFEIDMHDTVIRVNRVPQQRFFEDYGQRTDILFAGPGWKGHEIFTSEGLRVESMGQRDFAESALCPYHGGPGCRFSAVVLSALPSGYPFDKPGWRPNNTAYPLAVQGHTSRIVAEGFSGFHNEEYINSWTPRIPWPTNGFYSLVTFAPICTTLELFGFGGSGTADGHGIDGKIHNLSYDQTVMSRLASGELALSDWSGREVAEELRQGLGLWMDQYLADRGRRGCITLAQEQGGGQQA